LTSSIITLVVGREQRLFAAHEDVLCFSPFFQAACRGQFMEAQNKKISLPDEEPEIFSSVLEYLYKGDYYPRLIHNKRKNVWELETGDGGAGTVESTVYHHGVDGELLKDTVIYCTAEKYGLDELKRVALRKQGLRKSSILSRHTITDVRKNPESNAARSSPPHATPMPIPRTRTPSYEPTTSPS
jgi:hypothetical protein